MVRVERQMQAGASRRQPGSEPRRQGHDRSHPAEPTHGTSLTDPAVSVKRATAFLWTLLVYPAIYLRWKWHTEVKRQAVVTAK
jgi:hypothetical protein